MRNYKTEALLRAAGRWGVQNDLEAIKGNTPLEETEQIDFVQWLEDNGLKFTAIPNSTWTPSWNQKNKNRLMGLRPGLPDLVVYISAEQSVDGKPWLLWPEMKRQKGSTTSQAQKDWIAALNSVSDRVRASVCKGSVSAIQFTSQYLKDSTEAF